MGREDDSLGVMGGRGLARARAPAAVATSRGLNLVNPVSRHHVHRWNNRKLLLECKPIFLFAHLLELLLKHHKKHKKPLV